MVLLRCLGSLALFLAGADGARISRKRASSGSAQTTKFIGGVPVLNYHTAYGSSLAERQGDEEAEWVLMVKPGTTDAQTKVMCETNKNACNLVGHASGGVPFLEMRGSEQDLEAVIRASHGAVEFVELDGKVRMIPNMEADVEAATWGLSRIGADSRGRSGAGTTIFVIDSGVRTTHQEFNGRAAPSLDISSGSVVTCNGDVSCAADSDGHGTHCAGSAAGLSYGVAPAASVRSIKVLNEDGFTYWSWVYSGLDWLTISTIRPAVASMSLGGAGKAQAMRRAINSVVDSGVTVVVAAGNENSDACSFTPAFVPSAITVGSTTSMDARSSWSNFGSCTNIWAPGSTILSAGHRTDRGSAIMSGTSMACPHVSGAAALVLEADPSKKASAVLAELINKAIPDTILGLQPGDTNALLYIGEGPPPAPGPTPAPACVTEGASGITCVKWTSDFARSLGYTPINYPHTGLGNHNCCRNPDGWTNDWCLTGIDTANGWFTDC